MSGLHRSGGQGITGVSDWLKSFNVSWLAVIAALVVLITVVTA